MKYPKHEIYEEIYKKYFEKGTDYLINKVEIKETDKVLDICGGNARLTRKLKQYTNDVTYLDQEKDMTPKDLEKENIKVFNESIQEFVNRENIKVDKVFCQQAVNYWLTTVNVEKFSNIFNKNGVFVFNTFAKKPSTIPTIKEYEIENIKYIEISYLVENMVNHIQIREGYAPHFTEFNWISKEQYEKLLSPYFDLQIEEKGNTAVYVCRKK